MTRHLPTITSFTLSAGATVALLLTVAGCRNPAEQNLGDAGNARSGAKEEFFHPHQGEVWRYKVQREIPAEVRLTDADKARNPQRTETGHLITFERVRTCMGARQPIGVEKELTTMAVAENGEVLGEEFYEINDQGVFSRGWLSAGTAESEIGDLLKKGVALATANMKPGQVWTGRGIDPGRKFLFRVIEVAEITVPAGTFEAARIQISSEKEGKSLKRTIWFAANVGIVKEESVYYGPQRVRVRERAELVHWIIPSDPPSDDATLLATQKNSPENTSAPNTDPPTPDAIESPEEPGAEGDNGEAAADEAAKD